MDKADSIDISLEASGGARALGILHWIMERHVESFLDVTGRPLGEGRCAEFDRIVSVLEPCPYSGSRHLHPLPMNVSALQAMPPWAEVLGVLSHLSCAHTRRTGRVVAAPDDLAQVTAAGVFLPDYLALRRTGRLASGAIPSTVAALYKVCLGFQLAYLPERYADCAPGALPDASTFLHYLDETGLLIGEKQVCGGSPTMIKQAYRAIVTPPPEDASTAIEAALKVDGQWELFQAFAVSIGSLWHALIRFAISLERTVLRLRSAAISEALREGINRRVRGQLEAMSAARSGLVIEIARGAMLSSAAPAEQDSAGACRASPLAVRITDWILAASPEAADDRVRVVEELAPQVGVHEFEAARTVDVARASLARAMEALGFEASSAIAFDDSALSRLLGPTLYEWPSVGQS